MSAAKRIVICGGGAIGAAIAYFLSRRGARAHRRSNATPQPARRRASRAASWRSTGAAAAPLDRLGAAQLRIACRARPTSSAIPGAIGAWRPYGGYAAENDTATRHRPAIRGCPDRVADQRAGARLAADDGVGRAARLHYGPDARRRGGGRASCGTARSRSWCVGPSGAIGGVALDSGEIVEGDAVVIAMGPWSILASALAAAARGVRPQGPQPRVRDRRDHSRRGPLPRVPGGKRRGPDPRAVSARRRHDLGVRGLEQRARCPSIPPTIVGRRRRARAAGGAVPDDLAGTSRRADRGAPGVLPAGHRGWAAADRAGAGRRRRLRGDRPQRLGHAECAGDRRGDDRS